MTQHDATTRCPSCAVPRMPGQTRPKSFTCEDPWHEEQPMSREVIDSPEMQARIKKAKERARP